MKMDSWTQRINFRQAAMAAHAAQMALRQQQTVTPTTTPAVPAVPNTAPPPYAPEDDEFDTDSDDGDSDDSPSPSVPIRPPVPVCGGSIPICTNYATSPQMTLTVNASRIIQGSGNVLPLPTSPMLDVAKISTTLKEALHSINAVANENSNDDANQTPASVDGNNQNATASARPTLAARRRRRPRPININLTIDCGIQIIGDRNVLAPWALRLPPSGLTTAAAAAASIPTPNAAGAGRETSSNSPDVQFGAAAGVKRKAEDDLDELREGRNKPDASLSSPPASA